MNTATNTTAPLLKGGERVAVIGAGIVGTCTALALARAGVPVDLFDPQPPEQSTTWGNAGLVSVDSCIPLSAPGLVRQIPSWIRDSQGPLSLPARYLPRAVPWLLRRVRAGHAEKVRQISLALRVLHEPALRLYRDLLGEELFNRYIQDRGQWHVTASEAPGPSERFAMELWRQHGITTEVATGSSLHERLPGLSSTLRRGIRFPSHAHVTDLGGLLRAMLQASSAAGSRHICGGVTKLVPRGTTWRVLTTAGEFPADKVVLSAGMASQGLARSLGLKLHLQAERGYHVQMSHQSGLPDVPVVFREQAFVATPMAQGLRLAGTVEIAPETAPADWRRAEVMLSHARRLMPGLDDAGASYWVGSRPSTPDSLPIIGPVSGNEGLLLACGHGHFGLTGAPMTAKLLVDSLLGRTSSIDPRPYALSRFH